MLIFVFQKLKLKKQYLIALSGLLIITGTILFSANSAKAIGSTTGFNNYYNIGDANFTYSPEKPLLVYGVKNSSNKELVNIGGTLSVGRMTAQSSAILDNIDSWISWFKSVGFTNEQVRPANIRPDSLVGIDRNNSSKGAVQDTNGYDYEDVFWVSTDWTATRSDSLWFFDSLSLALVGSTSDPICTQMGGVIGWKFPDGLKTCQSLITWPDNGVVGDSSNNIYKFGQAYPVAFPSMSFDDLVSKIQAQNIQPVSTAVPGQNIPDIYKLYVIPQTKLTCSSVCTTKTVANLTQQGIDSLKQLTVKVYAAGDDPNKDPNLNKIDNSSSSTPATSSSGGGDQTTSSTAGTALNFLAQWVVSPMIQLITTIIYWLFSIIVSPLIEALLAIHPYKDVFVQVIYPGWLILRNLSNIAFIIVLLVIGMATLFQVEKYNYKHLLVKVIIAAVLVNFSLVIGQAVLGVADTVQNQFLPEQGSVIRALGYELMVKPVQQIQTKDDSVGGGLSNITYPFFLLSLALGAFLAFVAILVFLVVRIVGLWILLMVSPIAYVANVLPETQKYFSEWWTKFLAYAFITPIFAFFLNIAALFATSHVFGQGSPVFNANNAYPNISDFVYLTAGHLTVLVFLFAGLSFAGSSGVIGAKAVTDFAKKGLKLPLLPAAWGGKAAGVLAKAGAERGLEGLSALTGKQLDPRVWVEQWKHYSKEKKEERRNKLETSGGVFSRPENAFDSYVGIPAAKRLWKVFWKGNATKVGAELGEAEANLETTNQVLTDDDVAEKERLRQELEHEATMAPSSLISKNRASQIHDDLTDRISGYERIAKDATDAATKYKTKNSVDDSDPEVIELNKKAAEAKAMANQLKVYQADLRKQIDNAGQGMVNTLSAKNKMSSADVRKFVEDNIFNPRLIKEQIEGQVKKLNEELADDKKARVKLNLTGPMTEGRLDPMKAAARKLVKDKEHLLGEVRRPEFYYARLARTAAEAAEQKKLAGIDDAEELKRLYHIAVEEHNTARAGAIVKKLAKDHNFNELLEGEHNGQKITASADGMRLFFEKMRKDTGMSETSMLQLASEVSYINEENGWWDLARTTRSGPRGMSWNTGKNHQDQIFGEMGKRNARSQAANFARLAYVTQERDPVTGGWKTLDFTAAGMAILKQASQNLGNRTEFQRNLRANTAASITSIRNWKERLRKNGVHPDMIQNIEDSAGGTKGVNLIDPEHDFSGPQID
jgi:TrbL/VirB6 plasmid conjugal transfer protein